MAATSSGGDISMTSIVAVSNFDFARIFHLTIKMPVLTNKQIHQKIPPIHQIRYNKSNSDIKILAAISGITANEVITTTSINSFLTFHQSTNLQIFFNKMQIKLTNIKLIVPHAIIPARNPFDPSKEKKDNDSVSINKIQLFCFVLFQFQYKLTVKIKQTKQNKSNTPNKF